MITKAITISKPEGVHLRVASAVAQRSRELASDIKVCRGEMCADANSVLEIALLGAGKDAELMVSASGGEESRAVEEISLLLADGAGI